MPTSSPYDLPARERTLLLRQPTCTCPPDPHSGELPDDPGTFVYSNREAWARIRRTFYDDLADQYRDSASNRAVDYAASEEIAAAVAELGAAWRALGTELRAANRTIREFFPEHGRGRQIGWHAWTSAFDQLTEDQQAAVAAANATQDARARIREAQRMVMEDGYLRVWVARRTADLPGCPTYSTIIRRWYAARETAVEKGRRQVETRPVDDDAWQRELHRRAKIGRGPLVTHHSAGAGGTR